MSGIGYYYDENGVKQEMEIGPSFDDFPGMAKVTSPIPLCHACRKADFDEKGYETLFVKVIPFILFISSSEY